MLTTPVLAPGQVVAEAPGHVALVWSISSFDGATIKTGTDSYRLMDACARCRWSKPFVLIKAIRVVALSHPERTLVQAAGRPLQKPACEGAAEHARDGGAHCIADLLSGAVEHDHREANAGARSADGYEFDCPIGGATADTLPTHALNMTFP
ncbi:hypothetical protein [Streptomyces sp. NBC_00557]|uniref:hypothetical protein n=1 Tax=Streptomyces sp. NBC_00557 TaxID=2975776 RepID=UPI002E8064FA|nr:hypothetical protein [Streptomyces sp. NBC_00557]WUC36331.1 hypothetical protein OG956_19975 [Streptomyces sp. NBC_00557]